MGIAFLTLSALLAPFQWRLSRHSRSQVACRRVNDHGVRWPMVESPERPTRAGARATESGVTPGRSRVPATRPSRVHVIQCVEAGMPVGSSGRMVISGRLADVCAELDRLAANDARREKASGQSIHDS